MSDEETRRMQSGETAFPTRAQLWRGATLRTIVAAVWVQEDPQSRAVRWQDATYVRDDEQGTLGAVVFAGERVAGAFFDHESERSPFADEWRRDYDWRELVAGIPADLLALLEGQVLPFMVMEYRNRQTPVLTAALWGEGDRLTSNEAWADVFANGAFILDLEVLDPEEALVESIRDYEFSPQQGTVVQSLYERKIAAAGRPIEVLPDEQGVFRVG